MRPGLLNPRQILNHRPERDDWYSIANKSSPDIVDVYLYDEIGVYGTTATAFQRELAEIKTARLDVHISSKGGDVFDGITIYNALRTHSAPVTTRVDALAASIASVIAQAGDTRLMLTGSQMMIHEAYSGLNLGLTATDHREAADTLERQTDNIAGIYAERAGDTAKKDYFRSLMEAETWMTPTEAVSEGLADEVITPDVKTEEEPPENKVDWADFIASTNLEEISV